MNTVFILMITNWKNKSIDCEVFSCRLKAMTEVVKRFKNAFRFRENQIEEFYDFNVLCQQDKIEEAYNLGCEIYDNYDFFTPFDISITENPVQ